MNFSQFASLLVVVGILVWLVYKCIPMNRDIRKVLTIVLAVTIAFGITTYFDVFNFLERFHFGS